MILPIFTLLELTLPNMQLWWLFTMSINILKSKRNFCKKFKKTRLWQIFPKLLMKVWKILLILKLYAMKLSDFIRLQMEIFPEKFLHQSLLEVLPSKKEQLLQLRLSLYIIILKFMKTPKYLNLKDGLTNKESWKIHNLLSSTLLVMESEVVLASN